MATRQTDAPEIITQSHIDEAHAAGPNFPMAKSADGLFSWHSAAQGYVCVVDLALAQERFGVTLSANCTAGLSIYLQYAPRDLDAALLAAARQFHRAVSQLKAEREEEARQRNFRHAVAEAEALQVPGASWQEDCDGSVPDCSLDICTRMSDGSIHRVHTY